MRPLFWAASFQRMLSSTLGKSFSDIHKQKEAILKTTYKIDPVHSSAQFTIRHMMISNVRGNFRSVQGTIEYDPNHPNESRINAVIDASTISTLDEQRDTHLKSPDFLDVEKNPTITFQSANISPAGSGEWKVTGNLTIHGVTKPVTLHVEGPTAEGKDPFGNVRVGASASTKIKRSDFGLTWNAALETGGILVGDEVKIDLEISAIRTEAGA